MTITLVSLKLNKIFDPIRNRSFTKTPEEKIRQKWLREMSDTLGYPRGLICVEQSIDALDHVDTKTNRRADIICFMKNHLDYPLYPLLIIECKAITITQQVLRQVEGYNAIVKAYYFAVANETKVYTCWKNEMGQTKKVDYLPTYPTLLEAVHG